MCRLASLDRPRGRRRRPIPAGGPIPDGTFTLAGTLEATVPPWGRLVTQIVTTTPLAYTDACGGDVSGKMEMRLNGSTEEGVLIKWLSCGNTRYEFLGSGVL